MANKTLKEKLGWKPGMRVLMTGLPERVPNPFAGESHSTVAGNAPQSFDLLLAFVRDRAALREAAPVVLDRASDNAKVWIAYPKLSSKVKTDLTRDAGWEPMFDAGWIVVAIVSIDVTWSAVRFRPRNLVKSIRYGTC